jgi:uridine kinase
MIIIAISGATCSGKVSYLECIYLIFIQSSLTKNLKQRLTPHCEVIQQDEFYKSDGEFDIIAGYPNWDSPSSFRINDFIQHIQSIQQRTNMRYVIVEGLYLFHDQSPILKELNVDLKIFLNISKERCKERRWQRDEWIRKEPTYFEQVVSNKIYWSSNSYYSSDMAFLYKEPQSTAVKYKRRR